MYFNKWIQFALSLVIAVTAWAAAFDWTTIFSQKTAASIAGIVAVIKLVTNAIAPSSTQQVVPNGGAIVAQVSTKQTTAGNG